MIDLVGRLRLGRRLAVAFTVLVSLVAVAAYAGGSALSKQQEMSRELWQLAVLQAAAARAQFHRSRRRTRKVA